MCIGNVLAWTSRFNDFLVGLGVVLVEIKDPGIGLLILPDIAREELADLVLSRTREEPDEWDPVLE